MGSAWPAPRPGPRIQYSAKGASPTRSRSSPIPQTPRAGGGEAAPRRRRQQWSVGEGSGMSSRFWRWYADRQFHKWEKTVLWDMVEPYRPPRSFAPLIGTYVAAFYTGVVGAAITEQLYKVSQLG
jgi:hypothetical protein